MRNDLDHLPADRQAELQHIVRILFEEFEDTIVRTTDPKRKKGRILKVILYGSFARGDWVDDPVGDTSRTMTFSSWSTTSGWWISNIGRRPRIVLCAR